MDLSTNYLGFELPHPIMPGSSPLAGDLDLAKALEDAGASALVMNSLFEEQWVAEAEGSLKPYDEASDSFAEAITFFPQNDRHRFGPDEYLEQVRSLKESLSIPVIASLNGASSRGWLSHARLVEQAGADALELNVYHVPSDASETAEVLAGTLLDMTRAVKQMVRIPVSVKLSPFYSSLPELAARLDGVGVDGLVLFNRFYQPDFDLESLDVQRTLRLSDPSELLLRLRWLALLSPTVRASLAASGGVHSGQDALKAVMAGAHAVQIVSAILEGGPGVIRTVRSQMERWLESHEYESLAQARGSLNAARCPDASAYERANYIQLLQSWQPGPGSSASKR